MESGGVVEKFSVTPLLDKPAGESRPICGRYASFSTVRGRLARGAIEYTRLVLSKTNPAPIFLQYSSRLMVPPRLCSTDWRLLESAPTPANTLGLAAASITQSTFGRTSKSLGQRTSPWRTRTPTALSGS